MEDAVVKTVAGFLNTGGGTLLIGVDNSGNTIGLDHDYERVKPENGDGFVNWLAIAPTSGISRCLPFCEL
jgi:type I restriction enzyme, R subunit